MNYLDHHAMSTTQKIEAACRLVQELTTLLGEIEAEASSGLTVDAARRVRLALEAAAYRSSVGNGPALEQMSNSHEAEMLRRVR